MKKEDLYLREGTYNLFEIHPKSFINQSKILLKRLANNEGIINYKFLTYKIYFSEEITNRFIMSRKSIKQQNNHG